ncbi:MAG: cupin domain-containing protein [Spirochaetales bacterium]|nr:MAG: cupin domain-containing protein [Spirochaetales bacterium]
MEVSDLELTGGEKEKALARVRELFTSWGLTLPDVPSCPFHFGLHDFYRIGEIEFDINNNIKEGYCGKFIVIFKNQVCPMHYHAIKHETFYLVKGRVEMEADGKIIEMKQGDIKVMPQNTKHRFTGLADSLILECSKPDIMSDSIFDDERISAVIAGHS